MRIRRRSSTASRSTATAAGAEPWPTILADEAGRIRQSLREMTGRPSAPGAARPLAFLLDRNQRVLALADDTLADDGDLARWALTRWSEEPPSGAGRRDPPRGAGPDHSQRAAAAPTAAP